MELLDGEIIESLEIKNYKIIQNKNLYRFTSDAVLLSRFAKAVKHGAVADICSGSGIVGLHYFCLNDQAVENVTFFEMQKPLADMNQKSVILNGLDDKMSVQNIPIQQIGEEFTQKFHLVLCNPPYKKQNSGIIGDRREIAVCKHEITVNLNEIFACASKLLRRGGKFCVCHKCERIPELFALSQQNGLNPSRLQFVSSTTGAKPYLVLFEATKSVCPQFAAERQIINDSKSFSGE